jgi:hypothetical protein
MNRAPLDEPGKGEMDKEISVDGLTTQRQKDRARL